MQPLAALGFSLGPEISYVPKAALKFTANKANIKTSSSGLKLLALTCAKPSSLFIAEYVFDGLL